MDDLISRAEAIAWVESILTVDKYYHPHAKSRNVPLDEVIDRLSQVPSVEPRTGRVLVNWQHCKNLNEINTAIMEQDEDWDGLVSAEQIISITFDEGHGCYTVFWRDEM